MQIRKRGRFVYCTQNDLVSCILFLGGRTVTGTGNNRYPEALFTVSGAAFAQLVVFDPAALILEKGGVPPCSIGFLFHSRFYLSFEVDPSENPLKNPLFFGKRPLCAPFRKGVG